MKALSFVFLFVVAISLNSCKKCFKCTDGATICNDDRYGRYESILEHRYTDGNGQSVKCEAI